MSRNSGKNWQIPSHGPVDTLREALETIGNRIGFDRLSEMLGAIDPEAAARIDYRNHRRYHPRIGSNPEHRKEIFDLRDKEKPPYSTLTIGLELSRDALLQYRSAN